MLSPFSSSVRGSRRAFDVYKNLNPLLTLAIMLSIFKDVDFFVVEKWCRNSVSLFDHSICIRKSHI